ncbi:hypothetical protein STEG23_003040, partial [Scotinomys teguina]
SLSGPRAGQTSELGTAGAAAAQGHQLLSVHSATCRCLFQTNTGCEDAGSLSSPYGYGYPKPSLHKKLK